MEYFTLHGRGDAIGQRVVHTDEQSEFVADCYELTPKGRRQYDSAFFSRPKGADKSGLGARFALFEALGPCRFAGFARGGEEYSDPWGLGFVYVYIKGEPMGRPIRAPFVRCMATEEGQTGNVYDSILYNLTDSDAPLSKVPGIDAANARIFFRDNGAGARGEIRPSTASAAAKDGGLETFVVFDETHVYKLPELRDMYDTVVRNMVKRKKTAETWYLETTTMFADGEDSIAERSYGVAAAIEQGKLRRTRHLSDHRWGECEDLDDDEALRAAIEEAFGDAIGFNDVESVIDQIFDPRANTNDSRRFFLNAPSGAQNAFLAAYELADRVPELEKVVKRNEPITLGFDGSRKRQRGVTDSTGLVGCRVSDGHVFLIRAWEQPPGAAGKDWQVPAAEVDVIVTATFREYNVVAFYCDPAGWETWVAKWEAAFGSKLKVKATLQHPCQWWMTGGRASKSAEALEMFRMAVVEDEMTYDGSSTLTTHFLNARNRASRYGMQVAKENPDSPKKIDALIAATLAWRARIDALAKGIGRATAGTVKRLR